MEIEEHLFCKICHEKFNENINKPIILTCGHTFCEFCIKKIFQRDLVNCPFCKVSTPIYRNQKFNVNYTLLEMVSQKEKAFYQMCQEHKKEVLKFFCKTHEKLICQECLLMAHLGPGHEIEQGDKYILAAPLKKKISIIKTNLENNLKNFSTGITVLEKDKKSCLTSLEYINTKLHELLDHEYKNVVTKVEEKFMNQIESARKNIASTEEKMKRCETLEKNLMTEENEYIVANEETNVLYELIESNSNYNEIKPIESPFDAEELIILKKEQICSIMEQQNPFYDPRMEEFLDELREENLIKSDRVFKTMMRINRKNYVVSENIESAYLDRPLQIICNTTISAPHMHARTLEELKDYLIPGIIGLDIGSGSGYMTAAMADLAGKNSKIYAIDHIEQIVEFSKSNIKKKNNYLIDEKRVEFIVGDGRKGVPQHGPYDVIHVGGALPVIPQELEMQLKNGGRMWIPVGNAGSQAIYLVDKDSQGSIRKRKLIDVSYGSLTTVEEQMNL